MKKMKVLRPATSGRWRLRVSWRPHSVLPHGPATWWPRLRGQLADRQLSATEAVRQAEVEAEGASLTLIAALARGNGIG